MRLSEETDLAATSPLSLPILLPTDPPTPTHGTSTANQYSNKRWCCNDQTHFDVSAWAYEKLADRKWGVIGEFVVGSCCAVLCVG